MAFCNAYMYLSLAACALFMVSIRQIPSITVHPLDRNVVESLGHLENYLTVTVFSLTTNGRKTIQF